MSEPGREPAVDAPGAGLSLPRSGLRGWLTLGIYQPLFALAFLFYSPVALWRLMFAPKGQRVSMRERMGRVPRRRDTSRPLVWIHGVSVGEVKAASNFVAELQRLRPDVDLVISTTTPNGRLVARQEYPDLPVVTYPLDLGYFPSRALSRLQPCCVLLMELEIWPNFLQAARKRDIPVAVINGRISERTFKGYRLARALLPQLDLIGRYSDDDSSDSPLGQQREASRIALQLSLPIYSGGAARHGLQAALAEEDSLRAQLDLARRQAAQEARNAWRAVDTAYRRLAALSAAADAATLALQATRDGVEIGRRTQLDLLAAQSAELRARRDLVLARYALLRALTRREAAIGDLRGEDVARLQTLFNRRVSGADTRQD